MWRTFLQLVSLAVAGSWTAGALLAATPSRNGPKHLDGTIPAESVPVHVLGGFLVVAQGQIGGERQNFILDTGTSPSILNTRVAWQLGLALAPAIVTAIGREAEVAATSVPRLRLGTLQVEAATFFVTDLTDVERAWNIPIAGILGLDILGKRSFRLDYERALLEFGEVSREGIPIGLSEGLNLPIAEVRINGKALRLLVDTGSDHLVFFAKNAGAVLPEPSSAPLQGNSVAGGIPVRQALPLEFEWSGRRFQQNALVVPGRGESLFDGLMSVRSMGFRSLAMDSRNRVVYLQK
ncbi:MAG TPA: pepsin/retropepsin-like aspartic protease family protein [Candidatus Acidoferrum sp.]|nr:pepsin/retropepsin-like aspartic protease family protein [Candidatus Acidoferrum sp.]